MAQSHAAAPLAREGEGQELHLTAGQILVLLIIFIVVGPILLRLLGPFSYSPCYLEDWGVEDRAAGVGAGLAEAAEASGVLVEVPRAGAEPAEAGKQLWSAAALLPHCNQASLLAVHWTQRYLDQVRLRAELRWEKRQHQLRALQSPGARTMKTKSSSDRTSNQIEEGRGKQPAFRNTLRLRGHGGVPPQAFRLECSLHSAGP